jgi:hypothetical protein
MRTPKFKQIQLEQGEEAAHKYLKARGYTESQILTLLSYKIG